MNCEETDEPEYLYMWVTKDEYRLPRAVAGSLREMARITGTTASNICHQITRGENSQYIKIDMRGCE